MYVNGYEIPDHNYGTGAGREYHICNAADEVVEVIRTSKRLAIERAKAMSPGDVPEPKPEPVSEPPPRATMPLKKTVRPKGVK